MSKQTTPGGFVHQFEPGSSNRTLLLLHGTGGIEKDLLSLGRALDPEAALLSPRGKVLENGMPRFLRRLAEGGALGYSNGANIAGGILLLRPGVLCGTALLRPMVPLVPETLPELKATPVLVSAGNHDPIVPSENVRELVALLRRAGADVTVCFENAGHDLTDMTFETNAS